MYPKLAFNVVLAQLSTRFSNKGRANSSRAHFIIREGFPTAGNTINCPHIDILLTSRASCATRCHFLG